MTGAPDWMGFDREARAAAATVGSDALRRSVRTLVAQGWRLNDLVALVVCMVDAIETEQEKAPEQLMRERIITEVDAGWERANPYEEHLFNEVRRLIRDGGAA